MLLLRAFSNGGKKRRFSRSVIKYHSSMCQSAFRHGTLYFRVQMVHFHEVLFQLDPTRASFLWLFIVALVFRFYVMYLTSGFDQFQQWQTLFLAWFPFVRAFELSACPKRESFRTHKFGSWFRNRKFAYQHGWSVHTLDKTSNLFWEYGRLFKWRHSKCHSPTMQQGVHRYERSTETGGFQNANTVSLRVALSLGKHCGTSRNLHKNPNKKAARVSNRWRRGDELVFCWKWRTKRNHARNNDRHSWNWSNPDVRCTT